MASRVRTPNTIDVSNLPEEIGVVAAAGWALLVAGGLFVVQNIPYSTNCSKSSQMRANVILGSLLLIVWGALALASNPEPLLYAGGIGVILLGVAGIGWNLWKMWKTKEYM